VQSKENMGLEVTLQPMADSLVSCGRLSIGQLPRSHRTAAVTNRRAGCHLFHFYVALPRPAKASSPPIAINSSMAIGAPLDLGQGRRGVDTGPSAIRVANLNKRLAAFGYSRRRIDARAQYCSLWWGRPSHFVVCRLRDRWQAT
jgi:hypothetical protein